MKKFFRTLIAVFFTYNMALAQDGLREEDLEVLESPDKNMMKDYLTRIVDQQFSRRDSLLSTFKTVDDWRTFARTVRDSMKSWTGLLPERTPLNARTTGKLDREGYIVEKVLFESRPNYLVSANLYLPKNRTMKCPALLNVIGHAQNGKANERYQRMSIAQVRNGFVVLTIDCVGQGERGELSSHKTVGAQAIISGTHLFNIMVWDAIRAIDYLVSRPEVDENKICITGSSGGGMMSTYILPFEDRIAVAIPTCNPNTWSFRVQANLATDHEQVFFGAFASGIDPRGDPLFAHVPKPLLLNTTTDDHLNPPAGVWDLNNWLYKAYASYGFPEKVKTSMVRAGHDYNREQREISYAWMLKWTGMDASSFWEADARIEKEEDLYAAPGGSVFNVAGSKQHHNLVLDYLNEHKVDWAPLKSANEIKANQSRMKALVEETLNINFSDTKVKYKLEEIRNKGDLKIRHFTIEPEVGIVLPGIILQPLSPLSNDVVLYIHEKGKSEILQDKILINEILKSGKQICAVDLRGIGETVPDLSNKLWDFLAGKPIFGQRALDVVKVARWLKESEIQAGEILFWGNGICALYGAFAGVANNDISAFVLEQPLISFESVARTKEPKYNYEVLLNGVLEKFDMPMVYQAVSPRPITLINSLGGNKEPASLAEIDNMNRSVLSTYRSMGKGNKWQIVKASEADREKLLKRLLIE